MQTLASCQFLALASEKRVRLKEECYRPLILYNKPLSETKPPLINGVNAMNMSSGTTIREEVMLIVSEDQSHVPQAHLCSFKDQYVSLVDQ